MAALGMAQALAEEEEHEPMTLTEAIGNTAMRNAIIENMHLAEALSPSIREQIGVHCVGMTLALCAGIVNAVGFAEYGIYVSHVTGVSSSIGLRTYEIQEGPWRIAAEICAYFVLGSFMAGLIIPKATLKMGQARYELALFIVAGMELLSWMHDLRYPQVLACAMGLQNAMITSWSGAVLRTTHMTGTATDLGSSLGRIVSRFFRAGCSLRKYSDQDWDEHVVDRKKAVLMTCLFTCFIGGGFVGAIAYNAMDAHALMLPAGACFILGCLHIAFVIVQLEPLAAQKKTEEYFTRRISGGGGPTLPGADTPLKDAPPADMKPAEADRLEVFIRQMSGRSESPAQGA